MEVQNPHYIYLLQEREFIKTGEDIYKVGKTTQENSKRFYQYPKGSKLLIQNICFNCNTIENIIIKEFKSKYKQRRDIGNEYFQGDCNDMINDIYNILIKQPRLPDVIIDENVKEDEHDQDFINNNEILSIIEKNKTEMLSIINNNKNEIIETIVNSSKFCCEKCNYYTNTKQDFEKHILTKKHIDNKIEYKYECKNCNKKYKSNTGLWYHKNICKEVKPEQSVKEILPKMEKMINEITEFKNIILGYSKNK